MSFIRNTTRIAAGATLGLALAAGTAFAQDMMIDEDLAAEVQQEIAVMPPTSETSDVGQISVKAEDGMLVIIGMVDGNEAYDQINQIVQDKGIDMSKVDNQLVVQ